MRTLLWHAVLLLEQASNALWVLKLYSELDGEFNNPIKSEKSPPPLHAHSNPPAHVAGVKFQNCTEMPPMDLPPWPPGSKGLYMTLDRTARKVKIGWKMGRMLVSVFENASRKSLEYPRARLRIWSQHRPKKFFRALHGMLARRSQEHCYRYQERLGGRPRGQNFQEFFLAIFQTSRRLLAGTSVFWVPTSPRHIAVASHGI